MGVGVGVGVGVLVGDPPPRKLEVMYIKDWITIQDVGGSKGFRAICALRKPYLGIDDTLNFDPYQSCGLAAL